MVGAYVAFTISRATNFWIALVLAPLIVGAAGAAFERFVLRRVHKFGHVPELLITFGLSYIILELVQLVWGRAAMPFSPPASLQDPLFTIVTLPGRALAGLGRAARSVQERRRRQVHDLPAVPRLRHVGRGADAGGDLALADAHAHRPRDPGGADAPGDDRVARPQRAARVHARLRRRHGAGGVGGGDRRRFARHRAGHGVAGRRGGVRRHRHRRHGLAGGCVHRRGAARHRRVVRRRQRPLAR